MHKISYSKMEWFKENYLNILNKLNILEIKSSNDNYKDIFNEKNWEYSLLDVNEGTDVDFAITDIYNWFEVGDNSFDVIVSFNLFEKSDYFWIIMKEIGRVLKPGGYIFLFGSSNDDNYVIRKDGIKAMIEYANLEIDDLFVEDNGEQFYYYFIASKSPTLSLENSENLENRMNELEGKLDLVISSLK